MPEFRRDYLMALGAKMISEEKAKAPPNPEESDIPAGYTYLGQFIDHDLTFDPVSSLQRANDVESMVNYRTPRFDLDCVYGRGPHDQPYLYEDGVRLLLGEELDNKIRDVPRNINGRAV
ncbi:MAG TPA: peroxidase, partial [Myxococcales bacterium]